jgi:hypothetical protein
MRVELKCARRLSQEVAKPRACDGRCAGMVWLAVLCLFAGNLKLKSVVERGDVSESQKDSMYSML